MEKITVNGIEYVRAESGDIKIVVLERGFVYIGRYSESGDVATIHDARCIVRWGTSKHLGELVNGPLPGTRLGAPCTIKARLGQIVHTVEVNQNEWTD